VIAILIDWST